jgi:hypothetical protein
MESVRRGRTEASATPDSSIVKRFENPERILAFDYGRLEIITVGGRPIGKGSYAPGWRWSHGGAAGAVQNRLPDHIGVVLSGRIKVRNSKGQETDLVPGDFFSIAGEGDAWVVGYRTCEILYLSGVEALVQQLNSLRKEE